MGRAGAGKRMWDFSIGTSFSLVARTLPFVALRLVVYLAISIGFVLGTGIGAGVGFGIGAAFHADNAVLGALIGALVGLCLVFGVLWWVRQYILYLVKAGHVAAMDLLLRGGTLPAGQDQISYATTIVKARFIEVNVLFGVDVLIRGAIHALVGLANMLTFWLPGAKSLTQFLDAVMRVVLGLLDEVILAYIIRQGTNNAGADPWNSARDGLVLYAQNAGMLVKNAVWIALAEYALAVLIFILVLGPAIGLAYAMPGGWSGFGVVFALLFAWCLKRALIEPLSIASLLQSYYLAIEGQTPDPDWVARLDSASSAFRKLGAKAPQPTPQPAPQTGVAN